MNDNMWQAVFLARSCALHGSETVAEDAREADQTAYARWQESKSIEDLCHSIRVGHWRWEAYKHHRALRDAHWEQVRRGIGNE